MAWLQQSIMERRRLGGIQADAPLLTRMYQLLSDGMLGYEQCRCVVYSLGCLLQGTLALNPVKTISVRQRLPHGLLGCVL